MKRSVAIKQLKDYLEAQDVLGDISEDVLDFIEKEIGMMPPPPVGYSYFIGEVNEWEEE